MEFPWPFFCIWRYSVYIVVRGVCGALFFLRWCWPEECALAGAACLLPRAPPPPGRARHLSPSPRSGKVQCLVETNDVRTDAPSEATHMAYSTCGAVVMATFGQQRRTWRTQLAELPCTWSPKQRPWLTWLLNAPVRTEKTRKAYPACEAVHSPARGYTCSDVRSDAQCGSS